MTRCWMAALAGAMILAACGSSEPATQQPAVSVPTTGTTLPAAGTGAGAAGSAGGVTSVMCGAMACSNPATSFITTLKMFMPAAMLAQPCCLATGGCGWMTAAGCTPPPDKAACPATSIPNFGAGLSGCCLAATQTCGIDSSAVGLGCMASPIPGAAATRCDGTPVAPPTTGAAGAVAPTAGAVASAGIGAAAGALATAGTVATAGIGAATAGIGAAAGASAAGHSAAGTTAAAGTGAAGTRAAAGTGAAGR